MKILKKISRNCEQSFYIKEIDGLRSLAISAVVIKHSLGMWQHSQGYAYDGQYLNFSAMIHAGSYGVHLFFAISGFVLAMPFYRAHFITQKPVSIKSYLTRRLNRLEIPYIIMILIFGSYVFFQDTPPLHDFLKHLLASLLYVHLIIFDQPSIINNNTWSLEIEVQFYLLMPFLIKLFFKEFISRRLLIFLLIIFFIYLNLKYSAIWGSTVLGHLHYFLLGILAYEFYLFSWTKEKKIIFDLLLILNVVFFYYSNLNFPESYVVVINPITVFTLIFCAFKGKNFNILMSNSFFVKIGLMCYTIYLFHSRPLGLFIDLFSEIIGFTGIFYIDFMLLAITSYTFIILLCSFLFLLIEKPFMNKGMKKAFSKFILLKELRS